ncbi:MAG: neutral/alkaline non-lysosomal ceramidase N-terminal domain-containing protein, partial [Sedimentisphaerales bacterium]
MRNILFLIIAAAAFASQARPDERPWSVGYAEADITPAPGQVQMSGFGRERYARGVLAPLLTHVVVLRDGEDNTGVLITADILDLDHVMVEAIRRAIRHKHEIPAENIMFVASHTHWGPAVRFRMSFSIGAPNVWYMDLLEDKILAGVDAALKNLSPAAVEYGWIDFRGIGCNRRLPVDGKITWGPYKEGSFDGHTPIFRIKRSTEPQQLLVVGHACHPTSSGTIQKWSPDYPGAMRDCLAAEIPHTKAVFVQGCGGDAKVVHEDPETGKLAFSNSPDRAKVAGETLA